MSLRNMLAAARRDPKQAVSIVACVVVAVLVVSIIMLAAPYRSSNRMGQAFKGIALSSIAAAYKCQAEGRSLEDCQRYWREIWTCQENGGETTQCHRAQQ